MVIECACDAREDEMLSKVDGIKRKYAQAVVNGNEQRLDDLLRSFGMDGGEIQIARKMIDAVILHGAITGGERFPGASRAGNG